MHAAGSPARVAELRRAPGEAIGGRPARRRRASRRRRDAPARRAEPRSTSTAIRPDLARRARPRTPAPLDAAPARGRRASATRAGGRTARENVADLCDAGSFVEYGALALAAQRARRTARRPDREHAGRRHRHRHRHGQRARRSAPSARAPPCSPTTTRCSPARRACCNHRKTDRLLELAERQRLPVVLFAEGGGGRPGDTDMPDRRRPRRADASATFARAVRARAARRRSSSGRCFAGNAALLGCCDVDHRHRGRQHRHGRPGDDRGRRARRASRPRRSGPCRVQAPNGVVDVVVAATRPRRSAVAQAVPRPTSRAASRDWTCADQRALRDVDAREPPARLRRARA